MSAALDRLWARLVAHQCRPNNIGQAFCPAHNDQRMSLSFGPGGAGRALVYCHAGCTVEAITGALGLSVTDLFTPDSSNGDARREVAAYDYRDESGELLFQVVRFQPKDFRQRRPDGRGGWEWKLGATRRVLFRLSAVIDAVKAGRTVYVVEGERDVQTLVGWGLDATCNPGGAGKWRPEYGEMLRGARVVIIPDADKPGRDHAASVAASLAGVADEVKVLEFPSAKDVTEWRDRRGGSQEELRRLVAAAPVWQPPATPTGGLRDETGFHLVSIGQLLDTPEEPTRWLVEGLLPSGGLSVLAAKPKAGKSTLARQLALAVARGEPFLGRPTTQGPVVLLALEDKRAEVRRHLREMGATRDDPIFIHCDAAPEAAVEKLRRLADDRRPVLIIVDTLFRLARVRDANDYATVTAALSPLLDIARSCNAHVMALHHQGKGERSGVDVPLGSTAIAGSVDTVLDLRRRERYRTIASVQRYGEDLPETVLDFDPATRTSSLAGTKAEADQRRLAEEILDALRAADKRLSRDSIFEQVEGRTAAKVAALGELVKAGTVSYQGAGRRGDPHVYYLTDSCFSVPDISRERGNGNGQGAENTVPTEQIPCSRKPEDGMGSGNGIASSGTESDGAEVEKPACVDGTERVRVLV